MRKIFYLLFITLFFLSCGDNIPYKEKITRYNNYYNQADSLYKRNNYKDAISKLNKAIDITDTLSKALLLRGNCYHSRKKYEKAEDDYSAVIDLEGEKSLAFKNRAINYQKQDEQGDFKDDIDNYIHYHNKDTNALMIRANFYISENEYESAITDYSTLIKLKPNNANFYVSRGNLYGLLGKNNKSISDYDRYISISGDSDKSKIYYKKALLKFSLKKYQEAINNFNLVDSTFAEYDKVLAVRGKSYLLLKDYNKSIIDFSKYLKLKPKDSEILKKRAEAYLINGEKTKSYKDFQKSSQIYWNNSSVFYKYSFISFIILLFLSLYLIINKWTKNIHDSNTSKRIYIYYFLTGILGGHYLALRFKLRFYIYMVSFVTLLIINNYEIISYYHNIDLFIFSIKPSFLNLILFWSLVISLIVDLLTIPFLANYSNYKFQKTISPNKAIANGNEMTDIEQSIISLNSKFNTLKNRGY